jgi:hypothetical protein
VNTSGVSKYRKGKSVTKEQLGMSPQADSHLSPAELLALIDELKKKPPTNLNTERIKRLRGLASPQIDNRSSSVGQLQVKK